MQRRQFLLAWVAIVPAACLHAQDDSPRPRLRVSAQRLHAMLSQRFPVGAGVPGLLQVRVSAPRLLLRPVTNQIGASLVAQALGPAIGQLPPGEVDLLFSLRYERRDKTLRAHQPEVIELRWPGLPPEIGMALRQALPAIAREAVGELVLHSFTDQELALAETMGFEPETFTVQGDGLMVNFGLKPLR
ncbi:DUF1439 domain-containing protein [Ramlibacter sp. AW1]|uniref:DUF1439 domain-containing protein n=1 Tax=Ramlibacter aurantiacus TaxID=2801330 RepID=A0A936ZQF6_9BURK|nr:DUF1439 domain-containing protein [Ramlibacter aurantiacus]MBL0420611.1 DUF1439 domain-containing protein [Ramlibacter aurantiacus]